MTKAVSAQLRKRPSEYCDPAFLKFWPRVRVRSPRHPLGTLWLACWAGPAIAGGRQRWAEKARPMRIHRSRLAGGYGR